LPEEPWRAEVGSDSGSRGLWG